MVPYGEVTILFTDIKNATKILETCERNVILHVYSNYINYTSKLLGEIISLFNGKIIESTAVKIEEILNYKKNYKKFIYHKRYVK